MLQAKLVIVGGKTNRSHIKLKLPAIIGRGSDADITISHQTVSRHHCRLEDVDGALVLRDNGSTNGTFIGKQKIKEVVIRPGDVFTVGPLTFRAEYDHAGSYPPIGDPTIAVGKAETIEFTPGDVDTPAMSSEPEDGLGDLSFDEPAAAAPAAPETPAPTPAAKQTSSEPDEPFDLTLPGEQASGDVPEDDFMADLFGDSSAAPAAQAPAPPPEPAEEPVAEAEPEAEAEPAIEAESDAEAEPVAEAEPAESLDDEFDLSLPGEEEMPAEEDFMASLFDDEPSPAAPQAAESPNEVEIDLHSSGDEAEDGDFDLQMSEDQSAAAEHEEDTTEMFASAPVPVAAPRGKPAPDPAPEPDVLDLGPIGGDGEVAEANGELDFFAADEPAPAQTSAQAAPEPVDEEPDEAPAARKAGKEKPAKKGWFGLGKGKDKDKGKESKRAASKAEEVEEAPTAKPAKGKVAAKQAAPELEMPPAAAPAAAAGASEEPDFDFLGSPTPSGSPAKEDDDLDNFFQDLGLN